MFKSLRSFLDKVEKLVNTAIDNGDVFKANEIKSNILLAGVSIILEVSIVILVLFNEINIFHMPKYIPRVIFVISLIIIIPILYFNRKTKGEPRWMRFALVGGNLFIISLLITLVGYNAILLIALPMVLSVRYCDEDFTKRVVIGTMILCFISVLVNGLIGDLDLNIFVADKAHAFIDLDEPLILIKMSRIAYFFYLMMYDFLPDLLCVILIGVASILIAGNGKNMIIQQQQITEKTSRIDTELCLAMEIQANMLQCNYPAFPKHPNIDLFAINYPAKEMGGDFYDYLEIDDDHVAFLMADVSGKGIGAAFFMAISKMVLNYAIKNRNNTARIFEDVNNYLVNNNEAGLFVTCWLGIYEVSSHKLTYTNAGHNYPIIIRKDGIPEFLKSKVGFVLAGMENSKYEAFETTLDEGDEIILYTDGVTEAQDVNHSLYGDERLLKLINDIKDISPSEQIDVIIRTLNTYMEGIEQFDDMTMLAMKINK